MHSHTALVSLTLPHIGIALREILGLKEKELDRVVANLKTVLERSRESMA